MGPVFAPPVSVDAAGEILGVDHHDPEKPDEDVINVHVFFRRFQSEVV